jgi:uncharacterized protein YdeI (YjbR/CyaY-like superfamily)
LNHEKTDSIWLVMHKKSSSSFSMSWSDAVDEALCFGWIDSARRTLDEHRFVQYYSKRKASSAWSKVNKDKIEILLKSGMMQGAGQESIDLAKINGSWTLMDSVEAGIVSDDLKLALSEAVGAKIFFEGLSKSVQKIMLYRIVVAKRPETRAKRITEIAENAGQGEKPKSFR